MQAHLTLSNKLKSEVWFSQCVHGSCRPEKHSNQPTWRWLSSSLKLKWCENRIVAANEPCLLLPSGAKQGLWTHLSNVGAPFWDTLRSLERPWERSHWGRDPVKTSSLYTLVESYTCNHKQSNVHTELSTHAYQWGASLCQEIKV